LPLKAEQSLIVLGLDHLMDDGGGGDEAGLDTALARCEAEAQGDVILYR
jgi:hypothetical protein